MEKFQGINITEGIPEIIALCGSSRFCSEIAILAWEFEKGGRIALGLHLLPQHYCEQKGMVPDEDGHIHHIGEQEGVEEQMDALHFKKIEMADSIYVVNVDGYIGKSTAREISYAKHLGKPIRYLEKHTQELNASEALFGFCGWLSTRQEQTIFSAKDNAAPIADLIAQFCVENNLPEPRNEWDKYLTHPQPVETK